MVEKLFVNDESNSGAYDGCKSGNVVMYLAICKVGKFLVGNFPLVDVGIKIFAAIIVKKWFVTLVADTKTVGGSKAFVVFVGVVLRSIV